MTIDDFLTRKRGTGHGFLSQALRVQRLWIDGRDRWVSLPRWMAEQELQALRAEGLGGAPRRDEPARRVPHTRQR